MNTTATKIEAVQFEAPRMIDAEDRARADFYALLANLFYTAPSRELLQAIVIAPEPVPGTPLATPWAALAAASAVIDPEAVAEEHETLFIGMGRPPVMLFGSFYMAGFMNEKPLAELRSELSRLGFSRTAGAVETEDHLAALCDVMRAMILGDVSTPPAEIETQRAFFARHMQPWVAQCCTAIAAAEKANYYKRVADLASAFFVIETEAFDMLN